jgi:phosphohistidine phosphatase
MKRIVIVRHAKSVSYGYDDDFNRDLKDPRGFKDAEKVSRELKKQGILPDLMVSSPALRALTTTRIFADMFAYPKEKIQREDDLYEGISTHEFVERLHSLADQLMVVYFFGHNPTIYYLIRGLAPSFNECVPTSSSVVIDFQEDSWETIVPGSGKVFLQLIPRRIK